MTEETNAKIEKSIGRAVKTDAPLFSVIIPAYKIAEYIAETLESVFAQTFDDYEIILVNDGSPDTAELESILEPFYDRIVYLKQPNGGAAAARNNAARQSRGTYLAFLDGDDVWLPEYLAAQIEFLQTHDYEMVYCDAHLFGETADNETYMSKSPSRGAVTAESLLNYDCNVITSGTIVERKKLLAAGLFNVSANRTEDFEMWFCLAKRAVKIGYQKKVLLKYRVRTGGLSGDNVARAERTIDALNIIEDRNQLTANERKIRDQKLKLSEYELNVEKGKSHLTRGEYAAAKTYFAAANKLARTPKLIALNFLMSVSPTLTLLIFKKMRRTDYAFIAAPKT